MTKQPVILLVDDRENDIPLMQMALKKADFNNPLRVAQGGEKALAYLMGGGDYADRTEFPLPGLVLLDLNMPMKNGFDVLNWVRTQPALTHIPVIVLSTSVRPEDVTWAFDLGASSFLVKPIDFADLIKMCGNLRDWLQINHFPLGNEWGSVKGSGDYFFAAWAKKVSASARI